MSDESTLRAMPEYEGEEEAVERVLAELARLRAQMTDMAKLLGEGRVEIVRLREAEKLARHMAAECDRLREAEDARQEDLRLSTVLKAENTRLRDVLEWIDHNGETLDQVLDIVRNALKETT